MSEITAEVSSRICQHMNDDHSNAVLLYAQTFGGLKEAQAAEMQAIDNTGMDISVQVDDKFVPVRINFDHVLQDSEDAHHTLIAMVKQARQS
jgi:putative heme iron utilization protein